MAVFPNENATHAFTGHQQQEMLQRRPIPDQGSEFRAIATLPACAAVESAECSSLVSSLEIC
jgi:hypothetical protein